MTLVKIVAIVRNDQLQSVEARLIEQGIPGITVSTVKGFGEYTNFFTHDWMAPHARIEIFTGANDSDRIIRTIQQAAHTGSPGDGLIAILPVDKLIKIRSGQEMNDEADGHGRLAVNTSLSGDQTIE
ncbi:P-II family nitrogen regulator [Planctomycetales bacterium ZRK34]|nr:P-II family nitrogen regulator [Planctomycetales bacterium ZRK34]